jgi:hypothetical protein
MLASNIQDLNVSHPAQDSGDPQDLLLGQAHPDLTAQLKLWTNLAFHYDEALTLGHEEQEVEKGGRSPASEESIIQKGHVNGDAAPFNQNPNSSAVQPASLFDIHALLTSFGIDAFEGLPSQLQQQPTTISPSLTQLQALHSHNPPFGTDLPQYIPDTATPLSFARPTSTPLEEQYVPTAKRAHTRKVSVTSTSTDSPDSHGEGQSPPNLSPAEAKRRRNTAASARFRLKKREREAALESKAKELETTVDKLVTECKGLHKEIGWLKGLVVAIAMAAQGSRTYTGLNIPSPTPVTTATTELK